MSYESAAYVALPVLSNGHQCMLDFQYASHWYHIQHALLEGANVTHMLIA